MTVEARVSDARLVAFARDGDKAAFAALVERHQALLIALCARALGDPDLAQDAAQEAILQALLGLDSLRSPARFGPWLAGIGLNVCRQLERWRARDSWHWNAVTGGDAGTTPEGSVESAEFAGGVRSAVEGLPPGQRAAILLHYLSGLTLAETAHLLGVEVSAVKSRLHKARRALRRCLWPLWKEEMMPVRTSSDAVEVRVADVRRVRSDDERRYLMLDLKEVSGERHLPIWVGPAEGIAIALQIEKVGVPRPLTFAFMAAVLKATGGRLREVRIQRLVEGTFFAIAVVEGPEGRQEVDCRPSDAISLALVANAPITVDPTVFRASDEHLASHAHPALVEDRYRGEGSIGTAEIVEEVTAKRPDLGQAKTP